MLELPVDVPINAAACCCSSLGLRSAAATPCPHAAATEQRYINFQRTALAQPSVRPSNACPARRTKYDLAGDEGDVTASRYRRTDARSTAETERPPSQ